MVVQIFLVECRVRVGVAHDGGKITPPSDIFGAAVAASGLTVAKTYRLGTAEPIERKECRKWRGAL